MAHPNPKIDYNEELGRALFGKQLEVIRQFSGDVEVTYSQSPLNTTYGEIEPFTSEKLIIHPSQKGVKVPLSSICRLFYSFPDAGKRNLVERIADFRYTVNFDVVMPPEKAGLRLGDVGQDIVHQIALRLEKIYSEVSQYGRIILISLQDDKQTLVTPDIVDLMKTEGLPNEVAFLSDKPEPAYVPLRKRIFV
ncbi:hypothetical protein JW707_00205 [Candidatus Woesearchaeota archaeon]|nr:hypothetical protein [Candidatus Woesearchaeota archaeon]